MWWYFCSTNAPQVLCLSSVLSIFTGQGIVGQTTSEVLCYAFVRHIEGRSVASAFRSAKAAANAL